MTLVGSLMCPRVRVEFEPHGVQDGEGAGQTETEDPTEVPHGSIFNTNRA